MTHIAIGRSPKRMAAHNAITYEAIATRISTDGPIPYGTAVSLAKHHVSGTASQPYPYQFVEYCLRRGWLRRVGLIEAC